MHIHAIIAIGLSRIYPTSEENSSLNRCSRMFFTPDRGMMNWIKHSRILNRFDTDRDFCARSIHNNIREQMMTE